MTKVSAVLTQPAFDVNAAELPAVVEVVPGALVCTVYITEIKGHSETVPCWVFVTSGLQAHGQREVVFMVRIPKGTPNTIVTTEPLRMAATLLQLSSEGRTVDQGGLTELQGAGYLGAPAILYVEAPIIEGVDTNAGSLLAFRLTEGELQVVKHFGPTRFLAFLGKGFRHYPFPPWSDPMRPELVNPSKFKGSILEKVPRLLVKGWAKMRADKIVLELKESEAESLATALEQLPNEAGFCLQTLIDPTADGCLVWTPGQKEPSAITPPSSTGQRLCGAFVMVVPQQKDDQVQLYEDGFALTMTDSSVLAFRKALCQQSSFEFAGSSAGFGFSLVWASNKYVSPFDGQVYRAEGTFRTHEPTEHKPSADSITLKNIVLLTSEQEMGQRITVEALSTYCKQIVTLAQLSLADEADRDPWELMIDVQLQAPSKLHFDIKVRGSEVQASALTRLHSLLAAQTCPTVTGLVHLQLFLGNTPKPN